MRLIIAGSRTIPVGVAMLIIDRALEVHGWRPSLVLCGKAPGPDTAGELWARQRGVAVKPFWAQWGALGNRAGPERNERMAREATHVLALWDGESTGTSDMVARARARGLRVIALEVLPSPATAERIDEEARLYHRRRRRRAGDVKRGRGARSPRDPRPEPPRAATSPAAGA